MVKFKFYDKKLKKFVAPFRGPHNVWNSRYDLELWSDTIPDKSVKVLGKLTKKNRNYDLYIKVGSRYEIYTPKLGDEIINDNKLNDSEKKVITKYPDRGIFAKLYKNKHKIKIRENRTTRNSNRTKRVKKKTTSRTKRLKKHKRHLRKRRVSLKKRRNV